MAEPDIFLSYNGEDAEAEQVAPHGGKVLEHTRFSTPQAELLLVTNRDGTHLELVQRKGNV